MTWVYYSDGTLVIEGTGRIADFGYYGMGDFSTRVEYGFERDQPWYDYMNEIRTVIIGSGVTSVGVGAFYQCGRLESVIIPYGVTRIGDFAFYGCNSLTGVTIPDSVTYIRVSAFEYCTGLTSVTIGGSVAHIWEYAFENCTGLTDVYYGGSESQWSQIDIWDGNDPLLNAAIHYNS